LNLHFNFQRDAAKTNISISKTQKNKTKQKTQKQVSIKQS